MASMRTSRRFAALPDTDLSRFGGKVIAGLTENRSFPEPPVLVADLTTLKITFDSAVIKADKGGSLATAQKNAARAALVDALNKDASYVDIKCDGDLTILLSSGYEAMSINRAQRVLNAPQIVAVENGQTGELKVRVKADPTAKSFVGRIKEAAGSEFGPSISFKNSKSIIFKGLSAGVTYVLELCAIGGSTGQSNWSDPASGMAQ